MSDTFYRKDNITYSIGTNMFRPIIPGYYNFKDKLSSMENIPQKEPNASEPEIKKYRNKKKIY